MNLTVHKPRRVGSNLQTQVDFFVHGYPVSLAIAVDEGAARAIQQKAMGMLAEHGVTFAGKTKSPCCLPCAQRGHSCNGKVMFGAKLQSDVETVAAMLEQNSELEAEFEDQLAHLPPEVALYQEVLLAAADPYRQGEVERWFYQLRLDASRGLPLAIEAIDSLSLLSELDALRKRYFDNDLLARWEVESLESESYADPEAFRLWQLFGALGAVNDVPILATYDIQEGLTVPQAAVQFGKRIKREAKAGPVRRTFAALLKKARSWW